MILTYRFWPAIGSKAIDMGNIQRSPLSFQALFASAVSIFLLLPQVTSAAGMGYAVSGPSAATVGQEFQVTVQLNSAVDIDTVRLEGSFTPDFLAWRGISAAGSLRNISPGNETDETGGKFSFGTFTMEDAANGNTKIATIILKALKPGTGELRLLPGTAAYSNGEGGDIPGNSLKIVISSPKAPVTIPKPLLPFEVTEPAAPTALLISSPTQPDQNKWYSSDKVTINWTTTKPVKAVLGSFDQSPETQTYSTISGDSVTFYATQDGLWYAHLVVAYQDGTFSRADFLVRIDRTAPDAPSPVVRQTQVPQEVPNAVNFGSIDSTSGIDRYEVWINGKFVTSTRQNTYPLLNLLEGTNEIEIKAVDRAGNQSQGSTSFEIVKSVITKTEALKISIVERFYSFMGRPINILGIILAVTVYWVVLFLVKTRKKQD